MMAHIEQRDYFIGIKSKFPNHFKDKMVLDIGSLDINGNNKHLFENCVYQGLDIAPGRNVDIVSLAHEFNAPNESYDVIISNDCFEHDMFYEQTFKNIVRILKKGGFFLFTCKTAGSAEHGTLRTDGGFSSPLTSKHPEWSNYYRNIDEKDVRNSIDIDLVFENYEFSVLHPPHDIRFWGIKRS